MYPNNGGYGSTVPTQYVYTTPASETRDQFIRRFVTKFLLAEGVLPHDDYSRDLVRRAALIWDTSISIGVTK